MTTILKELFNLVFVQSFRQANDCFLKSLDSVGILPIVIATLISGLIIYISVKNIIRFGHFTVGGFMLKTVLPVVIITSFFYPVLIIMPINFLMAPFLIGSLNKVFSIIVYILLFVAYLKFAPKRTLYSGAVDRINQRNAEIEFENRTIKSGRNAGLKIKDVIK